MNSIFTEDPRQTHRPSIRTRRVAARTRAVMRRGAFIGLLGISALFGSLCGLMLVYSVDLPQMQDLERYRPNTTTELYDIHGKQFGSFSLERRVVVPYSEFPPILRKAILSIEDKSFEKNWGVNLFRAIGAAYRDLHSKGRAQGASTLTMQLARNLFLSPEKTFSRKAQEVLLTLQIERHFTKEQIFALYANQIYLGRGTYGFEAGAQYYFSKHVRELSLPEAALLAALPKGPEYYSPVRHPDRALKRRNLVLSEMQQDGWITEAEEARAKEAPLGLKIEPPANSVAPYFVEEVRRQLEQQFGAEEVHGAGLRVYTTLDYDLQVAANHAVLNGAAAYERRHGWKNRVQNIVLAGQDPAAYVHPDWTMPIEKDAYFHALVTDVSEKEIRVRIGQREAYIEPADWAWTQLKTGDALLKKGDIAYVRILATEGEKGVHAALEQDSGAQASLMAMDNSNGEVLAMVGGRDFSLSQFNRATQAERQVGSSFKPYVYTAAVEAGTKPTDHVLDVPTTFSTPSGPYTPHNYEPDYKGSMTVLEAFAESRNIPALRLAHQVGIQKVIDVAQRFGVTSKIPAFLPVAIGAADMKLFDQVGAYAVFPNDGIRVEPHYIRRVTASDGLPMDEPTPKVSEVTSVETARTMMTLLKQVTISGTGAAASQLHHALGGKTGTTNNYTDAWFLGFSPSVTCGVWIGYDDRQSLGEKETGARAALPIWMEFMKVAIAGKPDEQFATGGEKKQLEVTVNSDARSATEEQKKKQADEDSDEDRTSETIKPVDRAPAPKIPPVPPAQKPAETPSQQQPASPNPPPQSNVPKPVPVPSLPSQSPSPTPTPASSAPAKPAEP